MHLSNQIKIFDAKPKQNVNKVCCKILILSYIAGSQEWSLCKHVISRPVEEDRELTGSHRKYPMYHITAHVKRRTGFYLWNVALIMVRHCIKHFLIFPGTSCNIGTYVGFYNASLCTKPIFICFDSYWYLCFFFVFFFPWFCFSFTGT